MRMPRVRRAALAAVLGAGMAAGLAASASATVRPHTGRVLLVGTFHGVAGGYGTIQAAVNAAQPGDWILVAPGDYHETDDLTTTSPYETAGDFGGVLITTSHVHLRGMSRTSVVVDGTKPGAPACSSNPADQQFGASVGGMPAGRNGIVVWQANGVSVDNLTVCNFFSGSEPSGNGVWWNGGDGTGVLGITGYEASYLTATSTYFGVEQQAASYGIFSSNSRGPASWSQHYASNQNDSGMYVGACKQLCDITISHAWMEFNALGYSGTNSGGAIVITHSRFDNNQDGFDTNTQLNGDPPAPQNGACPHNGISKITHTHSCWVLMDSTFTNNNNANAPAFGGAAIAPTGTGMTLSGGKNDTVMNNHFSNNEAWGILFVPFPDPNPPSLNQTCTGTGGHQASGLGCVYDPQGDALIGNVFSHNGSFGNVSNGDFGELTLNRHVQNCFSRNTAPDGAYPPTIVRKETRCAGRMVGGNALGSAQNLYFQALCDTGLGTCPAGSHYPKHGAVILHALPSLPSMPNPCKGVPANKWCPGGTPLAAAPPGRSG